MIAGGSSATSPRRPEVSPRETRARRDSLRPASANTHSTVRPGGFPARRRRAWPARVESRRRTRRRCGEMFGVRLVADGAKEPDFLSRASDGLPGLADLLEATLALSRLDPNPGTVAAYDEDPAILEAWSWVAASRSWTSRAEGRRGRRITDAGLDWAHTTATSWLICSSADQRTATSSDEPAGRRPERTG